jgi:hypothetical protein
VDTGGCHYAGGGWAVTFSKKGWIKKEEIYQQNKNVVL